jgi:hypothetical protein
MPPSTSQYNMMILHQLGNASWRQGNWGCVSILSSTVCDARIQATITIGRHLSPRGFGDGAQDLDIIPFLLLVLLLQSFRSK